MSVRERVLDAAVRICRERPGWTFRPAEIVAALPELNAATVRTHVMSRCCVNAPAHHPHRWSYFRRVRRGLYEILPILRKTVPLRAPAEPGGNHRAETRSPDGRLHVEVRETGEGYEACSPELPAPVRGATLDVVAGRLRRLSGLPANGARMQVDLDLGTPDPVVAAFERDVDRTLIVTTLRSSRAERLATLQQWMEAVREIRGVANPRTRPKGTMTELEKLLKLLVDHGVEFVVIGGVAATLHGSPRITYDLDVAYNRSEENLRRLVAALRDHRPYLRGAPPGLPFAWDETTLRRGLNFTLRTDLGNLDLLGEVTGGGTYVDLYPASFDVQAWDLRFRCLGLDALIHCKRAAGRPRDLEALAELEIIRKKRDRSS